MNLHIKLILPILALAITMTSCVVSKDIAVPAEAVPTSFRHAAIKDTNSMAYIKWRDFFTEASLRQLIDSALVRNNDLLTAQKNIEIARLQLSQAKWGNVPTLNLEANATSTNPSDNSLNGLSLSQFTGQNHIDDFTLAANLSWEADIWGKVKSRKKGALAQYLRSAEVKKALQTTIVATVAKGFYNLLMLDAQLAVAKRNLELNEKTLQMIRLQYDSGQVTSLAVQQADAQRLVAAQLIPELEQFIAVQENALSVITGRFPDMVQRRELLGDVVVRDSLSAGIPFQMLSRRPDVKAAEYILQRSNAETAVAKAQLYPSLSISATGGLNAFEASNWFTMPASLFASVAGGLTQPLLNGKKLRTNYKISASEREKAVINFRQSVLVAVGEVADALVAIDKRSQSFTAADDRVAALEKAVSNADQLFRAGLANYLEVITVQGNLLQSELERAARKKARLDAAVELYRALGGGWE